MRSVVRDGFYEEGWVEDLCYGLGLSFLLGCCSFLSFFLPFTPIPVTIQVQVVLIVSALLGPNKGFWMVFFYLLQGIMGFGVFAGGGALMTLLGPRGGYLIGYLASSYVVGSLYQRAVVKNRWALFKSMTIGNCVVYLFGFVWLSLFLGCRQAFVLGVVPFILLDLFKIFFFVMVCPFFPSKAPCKRCQ